SPAEVTEDQQIEHAGAAFAQAIVDGDFDAAHALLAPWLQRDVSPPVLRAVLTRELIDGTAPADFDVSGNSSTLDDLREHYREHHDDDRSRTFASVESFGAWGPPSIHIADEITPQNFRQWMAIEFTPDPDGDSGLDY